MDNIDARKKSGIEAGAPSQHNVEVRIRGLMMDPATNMPIVVLKDVASDTVMPIWVGIFEANAIALEMEKVATPRPMTTGSRHSL